MISALYTSLERRLIKLIAGKDKIKGDLKMDNSEQFQYYDENSKSLPDISGREFKFLRRNADITQKAFAIAANLTSEKTVSREERKPKVRAIWIKFLLREINYDYQLFNLLRKRWHDLPESEKQKWE